MTQTNDHHVFSANLLIHQNSERTGQQQQDTNRQPDVATNLLIPQRTERAPGHLQGIIFRQLFIHISVQSCKFIE
ncbi:hypothetical protein Hanom_Chr06g00572691 [Helianthus anomalus]